MIQEKNLHTVEVPSKEQPDPSCKVRVTRTEQTKESNTNPTTSSSRCRMAERKEIERHRCHIDQD